MYEGVFTALITPFKDSELDLNSYEKLIEWQIEQGVHGLVPAGTTGESPTLNHEEHLQIIETCVKTAAGRVPVIAGTGSNSTDEAVMLTREAAKRGADAALIMSPYYNKPTQEGLFQHFETIHDATDIPIFLYNIPGRCVVDINDETITRLAKLPRIVGMKDATGDLARPGSLRTCMGEAIDSFTQLSGEDETTLSFNALGGRGVISVTSNIVPKACVEVQNLWKKGEVDAAKAAQNKLLSLHQAMFCETSPGPVKYAASLLGLCAPELRLPMVLPSEEHRAIVRDALIEYGLEIRI